MIIRIALLLFVMFALFTRISLLVHQHDIGGSVSRIENGKYFIQDASSKLVEVTGHVYKNLRFHEWTASISPLIGAAAVCALGSLIYVQKRLKDSTKSLSSNTLVRQYQRN